MSPHDLTDRVLLEDGPLLVIDKPAGLPSTGRSLDDEDCLQHAVIARAGTMVWAVHQLDADTSGVNLFTTERRAVAPLKEAMGRATAAKVYHAVVHGRPSWDERVETARIGPVDERSLGVTAEGRTARTELRVRARSERHALLEVRLRTGRTHQIRIHAAHLGHPLVGEEWYRRPPCHEHPRQALHASRLVLGGPFPLDVRAPFPDDLARLAARLGLAPPLENPPVEIPPGAAPR